MSKKGKVKFTREDRELIIKAANQRGDGWANIYTSQGIEGLDKQTGAYLKNDIQLNENDCRTLFRSGFGRRVVERPVLDMVREWFKIKGDSDGAVNKYLIKTLKAPTQFIKALTWAEVYGGSIMLMGIDDGRSETDQPLLEPLKEGNLQEFKFLRVYDRYCATWTPTGLYDDPIHPKYGQPKYYRITPQEPVATASYEVHESRLLIFNGPLTDDSTRSKNNWWNDSVYQLIFKQLHDLDGVFHSTKGIIDDFIQIILNIENLQAMIAAGQDDLVKKRLNIIDRGRHQMNTIMLDGLEKYSKEASSVSGLAQLLQEFQQAVSAVTGIPMIILMGRTPGGLNSSGQTEIDLYYDVIAAAQKFKMTDNLDRLISLLMRCKSGPTNGKELEDWMIEYNPLKQMSEKEVSEVRKLDAETSHIEIEDGVLSPDEVRDAKHGGEEYTRDVFVDGDIELEEPKEPEKDPKSELEDE